jgi:hypothetical protein
MGVGLRLLGTALAVLALGTVVAQEKKDCTENEGTYSTITYGFSHVNFTGNKFQYMKNAGRRDRVSRSTVNTTKVARGVKLTTIRMESVISWVAGLSVQGDHSVFMVGFDNADVELVSVAFNGSSVLQVARNSQRVQRFSSLNFAFTGRAVRTAECTCYSASQPPRVVDTVTYSIVGAEGAIDVSDESHAVPACPKNENITAVVYVNNDGDIVLWNNKKQVAKLSGQDALRDARIVRSDEGIFAVYTKRTIQRYKHGILGDLYEASGLLTFEISGCDGAGALGMASKGETVLPGKDVFEGISPMFAYVPTDKDWDNVGKQKLITTVSAEGSGAKIVIYNVDPIGEAASTAFTGANSTWRHQLMHANFGDDCESGYRVAAVQRPHSTKTLEFFEVSGSSMPLKETAGGYTSHQVHQQNLDMAAGGDFDGDGNPEVVLFDTNFQKIVGVAIQGGAAKEVWRKEIQGLGVSGKLVTSNVATLEVYNKEGPVAACTKAHFDEAAGEVIARSLAFGAGQTLNIISTNRDLQQRDDGSFEPLPVAYASEKPDLCGSATRSAAGMLGMAAALLLVSLQVVMSP